MNRTEPEKLMTLRPPVQTCPELTDGVSIFGYGFNTQCRRVGGDGVGREDVIEQGFADAVDIWSVVSSRVELCFHNEGYLVFLDAAYAPRKLMPLLSFERNGMTCGQIDRAGTVVLLSDPMQLDQPIVPPDPVPPDASRDIFYSPGQLSDKAGGDALLARRAGRRDHRLGLAKFRSAGS